MMLLRARHMLEDDAREAIVTAIYEENELLERERADMQVAAPTDAG